MYVNAHNSNENLKMKISKFDKNQHAQYPTRGSSRSIGLDLHTPYSFILPKCSTIMNKYYTVGNDDDIVFNSSSSLDIPSTLVKTNLMIEIPKGYYGRIAEKSGLALKDKIAIGGGVIDEDYKGEIGVILYNFSSKDKHFMKGDKIAQLIIEKAIIVDLDIVDQIEVENDNERKEGGFGSTGR